MFTALILACNSGFTECQTFMYPALFPEETLCIYALQGGIMQVENQGLFVKDYVCYQWKEEA